ncbi:hypothetical protein MNB_SM-5-939 [hydrothermal vent metagenome]|uniref:Nitrous oxide reductase maturation protein, outer-membrane lipoprotein NosL n=1 Tax=hydrothermal vent metagenome TaxID=652676 RepID=A0A1W1CXR8_9ZZZZ
MKKFMPFIVVGVLIVIIVGVFLSLAKVQNMVVIQKGNTQKLPIKMKLHKYQDSQCGMVIDDLRYASQVIAPDGRTWFFHDHGDFVLWLQGKPFEKDAVIWVMSRDTHRWIDGRKAFYTLNETTPMGYGFGAYEHKKAGMVDFATMRLRMLRGETMKNPKIRKQLLEQ